MDDLSATSQGKVRPELPATALQVILDVLTQGTVPPNLPDGLENNSQLQDLLSYLADLQQFALSLSNGDLSLALKRKGFMAGSLKNLQATLRHLTWQTQMIAQGDFSQRVDFMGDFSTAFNTMVADLKEARDKIEQRDAELAHANANLTQEVAMRKQAEDELRQQALELQIRNQELDAFAHTVAHDLKGPVANILGFAELLNDDQTSLTDEERAECRANIAHTAYKMDSIIRELLLLSQVRQAEVEKNPLDMASIVDEAQQRLVSMIETYQAEMILPDTWPVALGYGPWIEEVWANYISNALKYGGQPPRVELGADRWPGGMARFWARDNGNGLTLEAQARLFTPFTRLDQARAKGHGLGLSIVRRIVEKLGGQVGVESQAGQGSTFFFTLPTEG